MSNRLKYVRVGMRNNGASVKLKLRWDHFAKTCEIITKALPFEGDMWHAKYANHEINTLLPIKVVFGEDPPKEWPYMFPAPGNLMYIFHLQGLLPPDVWTIDSEHHIVDIALFYDRGNNLYGPSVCTLRQLTEVNPTVGSVPDSSRFSSQFKFRSDHPRAESPTARLGHWR